MKKLILLAILIFISYIVFKIASYLNEKLNIPGTVYSVILLIVTIINFFLNVDI